MDHPPLCRKRRSTYYIFNGNMLALLSPLPSPLALRRLCFLLGTRCRKDKFKKSRGTVVWSPFASSASVRPLCGDELRMPQARDIMSYLATLSVALVM